MDDILCHEASHLTRISKDQDLRGVTNEQVATVMAIFNHRPRKILGYRTPHEVFFETTTSLTGALTL